MSLVQPESTGGMNQGCQNSDRAAQEVREWPQCLGRFVRQQSVTVLVTSKIHLLIAFYTENHTKPTNTKCIVTDD
jgi:hypothetical protein